MELGAYIRLFRRWFWLLALTGFLGGGLAYVVRSHQLPVYVAQTMLSVGGYIQAPNPDTTEIRTGLELAQTYAILATTYDVLQAAVDAGDFPLTVEDLRRIIDTRVISGTSLLTVSVTYTDPVLATDVANEVARQLILNSPSNLTPEQQAQIFLANEEIAELESMLEEARTRLRSVNIYLAEAAIRAEFSPVEIDRLTEQRDILIEQINQASAAMAGFYNTVSSLQARTNSLDVVEQARVPIIPQGPGIWTMAFLGMVAGIGLAAGGVLVMEYLDDTIRTPGEATQLLALPILGTIPGIGRFGIGKVRLSRGLVALAKPGSRAAEEYRTLRTNLLLSDGNHGKRTYLFTSAGPDEGKSTTAANLAVTLAAARLRVLLIDADLRHPKLDRILGLSNEEGLTTLLSREPPSSNNHKKLASYVECAGCVQDTSLAGLRVVTSGPLPSNPTELLGSDALREWFTVLKHAQDVDVVLFDAPPALEVSDTSVLAATTGASIIIVMRAEKTRRNDAVRIRRLFSQLDLYVQGLVLNFVRHRDLGEGYWQAEQDHGAYSSDAETWPSRSKRENHKEQIQG